MWMILWFATGIFGERPYKLSANATLQCETAFLNCTEMHSSEEAQCFERLNESQVYIL